MNKRFFILIIILIFIVLGLYFIFRGDKDNADLGSGLDDAGFFPSSESRDLSGFLIDKSDEGEGSLFDSRKESSLKRLTSVSIAGAVFVGDKVRYVEKATGHIYEISLDGKERGRVSNVTIPKVFDVSWSESGNNFILSYLSESDGVESIKNFSAWFADVGTSTESSIVGTFLPSGISEFTISPIDNKMFYLFESGGRTFGNISGFEDENKKQIFNSSFSSWSVSWRAENIISLLTKPSGLVGGFLYTLNPKTKDFNKVLGGIDGLNVLWSSDGETLIYNKSINNDFTTFMYGVDSKEVKSFPLNTLVEKCVFTGDNLIVYCGVPQRVPNALYPDVWYQGEVSFSDSIWSVDVESGEAEFLLDSGNNLDVIKMFLSDNEDYLFFINKIDSTLWSLKIEE